MSVTVPFEKMFTEGFLNSISWEVKIPKVTPKFATNMAISVPAVNRGSLFKFILRYLSGELSCNELCTWCAINMFSHLTITAPVGSKTTTVLKYSTVLVELVEFSFSIKFTTVYNECSLDAADKSIKC